MKPLSQTYPRKGSYADVKRFREKKKQLAIDYLGGKCSVCDYDRCNAALQFHHLDPTSKDFAISMKPAWGFERIKDELDKCLLVCANCHAEIHNETILVEVVGVEGLAPPK